MNSLFQTICRIGIFMICAQTVIHFRPQESYAKYLKLLVSAMVLIQMFLPVSRLLFHGDGGELAAKSREFLEGLEAEMWAAERQAYESDALLERMTLEEIRRQVEEQAAGEETDPENKEAGDGSMDTVAADGEGNDTSADAVRIDRIEVGEIRVRLQTESPEAAFPE